MCNDDMSGNFLQSPQELQLYITGSVFCTKLFCDLIADVALAWPKDGLFDNSLLSFPLPDLPSRRHRIPAFPTQFAHQLPFNRS